MTERRAKYQAGIDYEEAFALQIRVAGLPAPEREFMFHPVRKWRFDFSWPDRMIAAEIEGGIYSRGRHVTPTGFIEDCRKYNEAACMGWQVYRFPAPWVDTGEALRYVEMALRGRSDWTPPQRETEKQNDKTSHNAFDK